MVIECSLYISALYVTYQVVCDIYGVVCDIYGVDCVTNDVRVGVLCSSQDAGMLSRIGVRRDVTGVKRDLVCVKREVKGVKRDPIGVKRDPIGVKREVSTVDLVRVRKPSRSLQT